MALNDDLNKLMQQFDQKQVDEAAKNKQRADENAAFRADCKTFFDLTVQPLPQQVGETLKTGGHDYEIKQEAGSAGKPSGLDFTVKAKGSRGSASEGKLTFYSRDGVRKLEIFGGKGSSKGQKSLAELTPQVLQELALGAVKEALG